MTATVAPVQITEPGVYDIPDAAYHADPVPGGSLSSSGARRLLPPSCPALFKWERDNPPEPKRVFDFGHAAHMLVLGAGPEIHVVDADTFNTKAAREDRDAAYAAGKTPLLRAEYQQVQGMAAALRAHPVARTLFSPERGRAEQSLFWTDPEFGIWRRARLDHLPNPTNGRMIVADYKTTQSAHPDDLRAAIYRYGYHQQAPYYLDGVHALGLADDAAFVFVFQMKAPPYLITIVDLDFDAEQIGRDLNRQAIDLYRRCRDTDHWPGYADDVVTLSLPPYAVRRHEQEHTP